MKRNYKSGTVSAKIKNFPVRVTRSNEISRYHRIKYHRHNPILYRKVGFRMHRSMVKEKSPEKYYHNKQTKASEREDVLSEFNAMKEDRMQAYGQLNQQKIKNLDMQTNSKHQIMSHVDYVFTTPSQQNSNSPPSVKGRRPLHVYYSTSSDEEQTQKNISPKKPFFSERAKVAESKDQRKIIPYNYSREEGEEETVVDDDCVLFIREFKNVKTKSPSPVFPSKKSRKISTRPQGEQEQHLPITPTTHNAEDSNKTLSLTVMKKHEEISQTEDMKSNCDIDYLLDEEPTSAQTSHRKHFHETPERTINGDVLAFDKREVMLVAKAETSNTENNPSQIESDDDDIIIVANDDSSAQYIDFFTLKRIVTTMVSNNAENGKSEDEVDDEYVVNRLKALYHQDFSHRLGEVQHCLQRAKQRYKLSRKLLQVVRPGLRNSDIATLLPEGWLNDIIINRYMSILVESKENYGTLSSFCYEELLRGKKPCLPTKWKKMTAVLIPICIASHWSLMCYLPLSMNLAIYNSMHITTEELECADLLLEYFRVQAKAESTGYCMKVKNLPKQENEYDCGVYVCMFARCVVCGNSFDIKPAQVKEFRNWLCNEIVEGKLFCSGDELKDSFIESPSESEESESNENLESGIEC